MAKFSTAPVNDVKTIQKINSELHESYWNIIHGATFQMPGTWFYQLGKPPVIQEPTDPKKLMQRGLDYCTYHKISVCRDCEECKKKNYFGLARWDNSIHLSPLKPEVCKFKYQRSLPTLERQAKTIWHEIAHIELGHCQKNNKPLRRRELEADMVGYLICLLGGRSYYANTVRYVSSYYRYSHTLAEMASRCEKDVLDLVRILSKEVK